MYRIALCDNDERDLQDLQEKLQEYIDMHAKMQGQMITFHGAAELLQSLEKKEEYDVFFLDIIMPDISGIELGRKIREIDREVPVIFTTSSTEFAFDAFGIHALDYLEKPVDRDKLFFALERAYTASEKRMSQQITINSKSGITVVKVDAIMMVENSARSAVYTLENGEKITSVCNRTAFEKSIQPIPDYPQFLQTHKSFFVNMNYVKGLSADCVVLDDNREIPISRERSTVTKKTYLKFLARRGE